MNLLLKLLLTQTISKPEDFIYKQECCLDHSDKPSFPLDKANYDCSQLTPFGQKRCNSVWDGTTCKWNGGALCSPTNCRRRSYYETHYGESIDVGLCGGLCPNNKTTCTSDIVGTTLVNENAVSVIKSCICDSCAAFPRSYNVEVAVDRCTGNCNGDHLNNVCTAGVDDDFNPTSVEPCDPSPMLISGILAGCSAGMQSSFDQFIDNRCLGHTFTQCITKTNCPLRSAKLYTCLQAANVPLTQTDSIILGVNGAALWGQSLPSLNGGTWNPGEKMCFELDLSNLVGGVNMLNDIQTAGHLDVVVQDDTAVDFLTLSVEFKDCRVCRPKRTTVSHLYTSSGVRDFYKDEDCDCFELKECRRERRMVTYFEGTSFEISMDVGQCLGKCNGLKKCRGIYISKLIRAPEGSKKVKILKSCDCGKLPWNPYGKL